MFKSNIYQETTTISAGSARTRIPTHRLAHLRDLRPVLHEEPQMRERMREQHARRADPAAHVRDERTCRKIVPREPYAKVRMISKSYPKSFPNSRQSRHPLSLK